ncbi:hypothetical protein [Streptomyces hoynatensis]|uniref:Uncharacterized protein n=1 Tax=Streptomyces hoynatensis TaxID=1141874 RepID=A0A3A9YVI1_9ACTN|nr:hypothetical protein [Streptomyces hoynatensis]RKN39216.1 hypothetical protein D7294_21815 [Streptomyces hoynatensis]
MRSSIRLALPIVATMATFALAGCADDDGHGTFGAIGGGGGEAIDPGDYVPDDSDLPSMPSDEGDTGSDAGTTDGGSTDGGTTDGGLGGGMSDGSFDGDWYVDPTHQDESHNLYILGTSAAFFEDLGAEGDLCDSGTLNGPNLTLGGCSVYGEQEWTDMTATLSLNGDGTLQVVWASGLTETYVNVG